MTECDPARRRDPATFDRYEACEAGQQGPQRASRPAAAPVDRIRTNPDVDAYYRSLAASPMGKEIERSKEAAATQRRIDGVRDRFSGPYTVDGQTVTARPMFRINLGHNTQNMKDHSKELAKIVGDKVPNLRAVQMGCCRPEDLVKVTQALIDAGKLPPGPGSLEDRIRAMQWEWGIGVDCAAYTRATITAVTGKNGKQLGLAPLGTESFVGLGNNPSFKKVGIADTRPGDIITLRSTEGDYGHNVIVHGHYVVNDAKKSELAQTMGPKAASFLTGAGPFHAIEVDSSWGAGEKGDKCGGYRRDTWLYDESTKSWGYLNKHVSPPTFHVSLEGPADGDKFHGAFRAR